MSADLMTIEPGGEQTQYESIRTDQEPHKKSGGQLGEAETVADSTQTPEAAQQLKERGENQAENIRYGQNISEHGVGGKTDGQTGQAISREFGHVQDRVDESSHSQGVTAREAQRHGPGNNIGA